MPDIGGASPIGTQQHKLHSNLDYKLESFETHETNHHRRQSDGGDRGQFCFLIRPTVNECVRDLLPIKNVNHCYPSIQPIPIVPKLAETGKVHVKTSGSVPPERHTSVGIFRLVGPVLREIRIQ